MLRKTIAVFTASYNNGNLLENSLQKIVDQFRKIDEVIVVDDGSNDNTFEVISNYSEEYPYIKAIRNKTNKGLIKIILAAIKHTKCDYFCGVGADDPLHVGFIDAAMSQLEKFPEAGLCCAEYRALCTNGKSWDVKIDLCDKPTYFSPKDFSELLRHRREVSLATCTTIWKKTALQELGGVIPDLRWHYDWFNAVVIAFRYGFCYIPKVLQTVNYDSESYSFRGQKDWNMQMQVLRSIFNTLEQSSFNDVRPYFCIPAIISKFGPLLLTVLLQKQSWYMYLSWELVQFVLDQDEQTRNIDISLKGLNASDLDQTDVAMIAREIISGLSAQYQAKALYHRNIGENLAAKYCQERADILMQSSGLSDSYRNLAYRYHDYWRNSQYIKVRRWLKHIKELPLGIRVAIYGTGQFGKRMFKMLQLERKDIVIQCFVDKIIIGNREGKQVVRPWQLKNMVGVTIDCVLLCSIYCDEIHPALVDIGIRDIACIDAGEVLRYFGHENKV